MNLNAEPIVASKSPLSALPPKKVRELPKAFILEQLELYYGKRPPEAVVETDYSLWRCAETDLEYAWPMRPGSIGFYEWVSQFESYYPGMRWEYREVRRIIASGHPFGAQLKVLDVGCGKGDFLRGLDGIAPRCRYALDLNEPAVRACRERGFQAFCGTVETAFESGFLRPSEFPVVTSFHCLEHVDQPVDFVRSLARVMAPGGRLFISTPFSPMSFEADWFDILNHPPHHMTRWNLNAYQRLAHMLGLKIRWFSPQSGAWQRTVNVFRLLHYGPNRRVSKARLTRDLLRHLSELTRHYRNQKERGRQNGGIEADVILAEFTVA